MSEQQHLLSNIEEKTVIRILKNYDRFSPGREIGYIVAYKRDGVIHRLSISKAEFKTLPKEWKDKILTACPPEEKA